MKKHVVIYGSNVAGQRAAANYGKSGYSVLLLNKGRFLGDVPNLFLSSNPRNICNTCLRFFLNRLPLVDVWHNSEITQIEVAPNTVKIGVKRKLPFVDESKCIECHECIGKGVKYIKRPLGGIYIKDETIEINPDELESLCPAKAINAREEIEESTVEADVFVIATEFEAEEEELQKYGYGKIDNVITLTEAEYLIYGGKTAKEAFTKEDGSLLSKVAFVIPYTLQEKIYTSYYHFYSVVKTALAYKELYPDMDITVFYSIPNFYGKGNIALLHEAEEKGIKIIYEKEIKVSNGPSVNGESFEMVVLGLNEKAPAELAELADKIGLKLKENGYIETLENSLRTNKERVFVVGEAHSAKSSVDSLYDGAAVVVESAEYLSEPVKMQPPKMEFPNYDEVDEQRVGLALCKCGVEFQGVNLDELVDRVKGNYDALMITDYLCLEKGQSELISFIKDNKLTRLVVGACSPFLRQPVIMQTVAKAGLDPVYVDVSQLKEFGKSVEIQESLLRFSKKKTIDRRQWPMPVEDYHNATIIIGSSTAALSAAVVISRTSLPVTIVSEESITPSTPMQERLLAKLKDKDNVRLLENVRIHSLEGYAGNFILNFTQGEYEDKVYAEKCGAILFAPDVPVTLSENDFADKNHVGIVCGLVKNKTTSTSRATCNKALDLAEELISKGKNVTIGMPVACINGSNEDRIKNLLGKGLMLEFFDPLNENGIEDRLKSTGAESVVKIDADTTKQAELARRLGFKIDKDGLFAFLDGPHDEMNIKLRPHDLGSKGIFVAGYMHKPMTEEDEIRDGEAQAYGILQLVPKGKMTPHPEAGRFVSYTNYRKCAGCALCVSACEYDARFIDPEDNVAKVREILCDGCAACVNACPSGAAEVRSLETKTMLEIINEALK